MAQEGVIGLDDQSVKKPETFKKEDVRRIKMKLNEVIRITFAEDKAEMRLRHFLKGKGYLRCLSYTGWCPGCIASEKNSVFKKQGLNRASEAFGANVFVYKTEANGDDPAALLGGKVSGDVFLFVFGSEKFASLRAIKQMYGSLVGLDLQVTCIDEGFQKMNIIAYPREASYASKENVKAFLQKKFKEQSYPLDKMIAKEVNPVKMIEEYGLDPKILETPEGKKIIIELASVKKEEKPKEDEGLIPDDTPSGGSTISAANEAEQKVNTPAPDKVVSANDVLDEL